MGPYAAGDAGTEAPKIRKICPVPHPLVGLFLHHEEMTWQTYFVTVHPVIVTEGMDAVCAPLTGMFRALSVGNPTASAINTGGPAPPPRSATLAREYDEVAKRLFPALRTDGAAAQQSDIATQLGALNAAQNTRYEAQKVEKEAKEAALVSKWLGNDRM